MSNETISRQQIANLNAALAADSAGCQFHPCVPSKKRPLTKWTKEATSDLHSIERLWKRFPEAIPAIVTGEDGGFTVIDLDVMNGKDAVTAHKALGLDLDDAGAVVETASGGIHLYFDYFEGAGNSVDKLAPV